MYWLYDVHPLTALALVAAFLLPFAGPRSFFQDPSFNPASIASQG
jgi:hypothetical protein